MMLKLFVFCRFGKELFKDDFSEKKLIIILIVDKCRMLKGKSKEFCLYC